MGIWDRQIVDLEALGVRFSDLEVDLLSGNWGFENARRPKVLHLATLLDPTARYNLSEAMEDEAGNPVLYAEIIELGHPEELVQRGWFQDSKDRMTRLAKVMDEEHGVYEHRFPSYFGVVEEPSGDLDISNQWYRTESNHPYPFWMCLPVTDEDAARRLVQASEQRIMVTGYAPLLYIISFEEETEGACSVENMWRKVRQGVDIDPQEMRWWAEYLDHMPREERRKRIEHLVGCMDDLIKFGLAPHPDHPEDFEWQGLSLRPIEDYLEDDYIALDMWTSILSRTSFMTARIESVMGGEAVREMHQMEI